MYIELDNTSLKQIDRGTMPFIYFAVSVWATQQDKLDGLPPNVTQDFQCGDLLGRIGQPITRPIKRINPDTGQPEFQSAQTGEWIDHDTKNGWVLIPDSGPNHWTTEAGLPEPPALTDWQWTRIHWPVYEQIGVYAVDNVIADMRALVRQWLSRSGKFQRGNLTSSVLRGVNVAQRNKLPRAIRDMATQWEEVVV